MRSGASAVFVNYRREDTSPTAGRLYDRLVDHFGRTRVFMDVYAIRPGDNWVSTIEDAVAASAVMLVLIGSLWAKAGTAGFAANR